jgi:hypothetical protein
MTDNPTRNSFATTFGMTYMNTHTMNTKHRMIQYLLVLILVFSAVAEHSALYAQEAQKGISEFFLARIGTTARSGLGGIVIPLGFDLIPAEDNTQRSIGASVALGHNVYRRVKGESAWQKLNQVPVRMWTTDKIRSLRGEKFMAGYQEFLGRSDKGTVSAMARTMKNDAQFWNAISATGSIGDLGMLLFDANNLSMLGLVYVDSTAVAGVTYEYASSLMTGSGEQELQPRGEVNAQVVNAVVRPSVSVLNTQHEFSPRATSSQQSVIELRKTFDLKEGTGSLSWEFFPSVNVYGFKVLRSMNGGVFEEVGRMIAGEVAAVPGNGITKSRSLMTFSDTTIMLENYYEYKIISMDYYLNEEAPITTGKILALDRKNLPLIKECELTANNTEISIGWSKNTPKTYYDKVIVYRSLSPDKEFTKVAEMPYGEKKFTDTDVKPNNYYYYKLQNVYVDGSMSAPSAYYFKWFEYLTPSKPPATFKAEPFIEVQPKRTLINANDQTPLRFRSIGELKQAMAKDKVLADAVGDVDAVEVIGVQRPEGKNTVPATTLIRGCVKLSWEKPENEPYTPHGYFIERSTDGGKTWFEVGGGRVASQSFTDTTTAIDQYSTFQYRIMAQNVSYVHGVFGDAIEVRPPTVKNVEKPRTTWHAVRTEKGVQMEWFPHHQSTSHIKGFNVYRQEQGSGTWEKLNSTLLATSEYNDTSAQGNKAYQYAYSVIDMLDQESNLTVKKSVGLQVPETPITQRVGLQPMNANILYNGLEITLVWDALVHEQLQGYSIVREERTENGVGSGYQEVGVLGRTTTQFKQTLETGKIYSYKIIPKFEGMNGLATDDIIAIVYPK